MISVFAALAQQLFLARHGIKQRHGDNLFETNKLRGSGSASNQKMAIQILCFELNHWSTASSQNKGDQ
jgi:hypothetical protein